MLRFVTISALSFLCCVAFAQTPPPATQATIDVIGVTPVDGVGIDADKYPSDVQVLTPERGKPVADSLIRRSPGINTSEAQANRFQPDISFRGFAGSPLLGTPQGIAVFEDGVRLNEPFGDVVAWDMLPELALASVQIIPGSNAAFGLNALGGVIALRTKTGFDDSGIAAALGGGSFGTRSAEVTGGSVRGRLAYFLALSHEQEDGWRDFAPSRLEHAFASFEHVRDRGSSDLRITTAETRLTGNGAAPVQLLAERRAAVFTHPDQTRNRMLLVSTAHDAVTRTGTFDVNAFVRRSHAATVNGDESPYTPCASDPAILCDEESGDVVVDAHGEAFRPTPSEPLDAVLNRSDVAQTTFGVTAQWSRASRLFGREQRTSAGATFEHNGAKVGLDAEVANLSDERRADGAGRIAQDSLVRLDAATANGALFLTDVVTLSPRATLTAAVRANRSEVRLRDGIGTELSGRHRFTSLNPSLGISYALGGSVTSFASAGQSSRTPTPVELTCANADDPCRLPNAFVSDPPLAQVFARTIEVGLRGHLGHGHWSVAAFRTRNDDDILFVSSGQVRGHGYFANVGRTERRGIETTLEGSLGDRLQWHAGYARTEATFGEAFTIASPNNPFAVDGTIDVEPGDRIPLIPRQTAKLDATLRVTAALRLTVAARSTSSAFFRGDEANLAPPLRAYAVADAGASLALTPRLSAELSVTNAGNARYATFGTFGDATEVLGSAYDDPRFVSPGQPRAVRLLLRVEAAR